MIKKNTKYKEKNIKKKKNLFSEINKIKTEFYNYITATINGKFAILGWFHSQYS